MLCEMLKKPITERKLINRISEEADVFKQIKCVLASVPALEIPGVTHPFDLFVDEKQYLDLRS